MVLIASDIASRGLDVDEISHIVNFDLPNEPETYVHRIGRTARAGTSGVAISFCDSEERSYLNSIQRLIKKEIPVRKDHPTYPARSVADELVQRSGGHGHANAQGSRTAKQQTLERAAAAARPAFAALAARAGVVVGISPAAFAARTGVVRIPPAARVGRTPATVRAGTELAPRRRERPSARPSQRRRGEARRPPEPGPITQSGFDTIAALLT